MKVNNYPVKTPAAGDRLFGSDANGDQVQFDMTAVSNNVFTYEIGEYVADEGGVIFHRYIDNDVQYYLVVAITDQSTGQAWSNVTSTAIGSTAQSTWDGLSNSNAIVGQSGFTNGAAKTCLDLTSNSKTDWYLPAVDELRLIFVNSFNINKSLSTVPGSTQLPTVNTNYWSSTENTLSTSNSGSNFSIASSSKNSPNYVRAVRKFSI
jgi:hypothetical protein